MGGGFLNLKKEGLGKEISWEDNSQHPQGVTNTARAGSKYKEKTSGTP